MSLASDIEAAARPGAATAGAIAERVGALDWPDIERQLDGYGCASVPGLLSQEKCERLVARYPDEGQFRSRIVMGRHGVIIHDAA